jgi:hypothetical protein
MASAYAAASDNGALPANARQIYYAARPEILRLTEKDTLDSGRFTQELLIDYMTEHADECAGWNVLFSDRGHFVEPHTGLVVGLGTAAVRRYLGLYGRPLLREAGFTCPQMVTTGPEGRFGAILYLEKEGFEPILNQARIAERFDLAIMSCKGMSVTAARELVDQTCASFKIPLYVLHDFGLRLSDVERLGLMAESVVVKDEDARRDRLELNGATEEEIDFLLSGRRVELNAMTSRQFIDLLEAKLTEHGVGKVIPDARMIEDAYRLFVRGERARRVAEEALAAMSEEEGIAVPADLEARVRGYLEQHPAEAWDDAVREIAS